MTPRCAAAAVIMLAAVVVTFQLVAAGAWQGQASQRPSPACQAALLSLLRGPCAASASQRSPPSLPCTVCAGQLQRRLRSAGCNDTDVDAFCSVVPTAERSVPWSPGVPGGIPRYPAGASVADYGAKGDGITDDSAAFTAAAAACAAGHAVMVPAGTFLLASSVNIQRSIAFRGAR
eukprot:COSAG01_NODE_1241_length_11085_cov_9.712361_4_plen_176_part_00